MLDVAIAIAWVAAAYRIWVSVSQPSVLWRTSFTVAMVSTALAFTLYRYRAVLDQMSGVWNLSGLTARGIFAVGIGFLLIYLDFLRRERVPNRTVVTYLSTTAIVIVIMVSSWVASPVHDRTVDDLLELSAHVSVVVYCVSFWVFLIAALAIMARTCLARGRTFRHDDLARSVSLLLIGGSAVVAIPVLMLWTASLLIRHRGGDPGILNAVGDAILPWPVLLDAAGVLSLLVVPYLASFARAWRHWRRLSPLWSEVVSRYPQVHLPLHLTGGPLTRLETRVARMIIETRDALRIAGVDVAPVQRLPVEAVAQALHARAGGARSVADVLGGAETREADLQQLMALSLAFRRIRRAAT
jgi:hypothetical protein